MSYLLFIPLYLIWLALCALLGLVGLFWRRSSAQNQSAEVERVTTICRLLNEKGLLTDEEYQFETKMVAPNYDNFTFQGYRLIMAPVFQMVRNFTFLDRFILWLVHKWMTVHKHLLEQAQKPAAFYVGLTKFCISIAQAVGRGIDLFKWLSRFQIRI